MRRFRTGTSVSPTATHPVLFACRFPRPRRHVSILRAIVRHGGDAHSADDAGCSALHVAAFHEQPYCVQALIDAGVGVDSKNIYGWTPLMFAASVCSRPTMLVLLKSGATVNAQSCNGATALHLASLGFCERRFMIEATELLKRWKADQQLTDKANRTAEDMEHLSEAVEGLLRLWRVHKTKLGKTPADTIVADTVDSVVGHVETRGPQGKDDNVGPLAFLRAAVGRVWGHRGWLAALRSCIAKAARASGDCSSAPDDGADARGNQHITGRKVPRGESAETAERRTRVRGSR